ncbi:hypothetical protein [Aeromonas sp. R5-4]|uniref:hypothetical protein n=1 Tax=Aeromonas sp. R5-4 TaxID=3138470 RepID=UPI0034A3E359
MKLSRVAFYTAMLISSGATYANEPQIIGNPSVSTEILTVTDSSETKAEIKTVGVLDVSYLRESWDNKVADIEVSGAKNLAIRFVDSDPEATHCSVLKGQLNQENTVHVCFNYKSGNVDLNGNKYYKVDKTPNGKGSIVVRSGGKNKDGRTNPQADTYQMSVELVSYTI